MSINNFFQKANKFFSETKYIEGLQVFVKILSIYPQNTRLYDEVKKATKKYKKVINQTLTNKEIDTLFEMQRNNKVEIVIKNLHEILRKNPSDALIISLLGTFYALENNYKQAVNFQKKAIECAPFEISFYQNLSTTLKKIDKNIDALSMLYFAKVLSLKSKEINLEIAKLNALIKNFKIADLYFSELIKEKELDEGIIHDYCMNLIAWKKENKVIEFLKNIDKHVEMKNLLLGLANYNLNNFEIAKDYFLEAIKINNNSFVGYSHLGNCFLELGYLNKAKNCQKKSLELKPKNKIALNNLGAFWYFTGNSDKAEKIFIESINHNTKNFEAQYYLGLCQLAKSNYKEGWENYSYRWLYKNFDSFIFKSNLPKFSLDTATKNLIIWDEQGVGDTVLFLRFLKNIKSIVSSIYMSVDKRLIPTIKRLDLDILFYDKKDFDLNGKNLSHQMPIGDLGSLFVKKNSYFLKNKTNYISSNLEKKNFLENKFKDKNKFKCGISWVSVNKKIGAEKSLSLNDLKPILSIPNITFIDLQYNDTRKERETFLKNNGITVHKIDELDNFNDIDGVISLIDLCDFVITISNSNAHFSGALGKETFLLLPKGKGKLWYWMHSNNNSIWYSSVKVIEQEQAGSWNTVIKKLTKQVKEKIK